MISRFRDPDLPDYQDARLAPDADIVPWGVLAAYALTDPVVTPQRTGSYNIHFKVEAAEGDFDLRRSNMPNGRDDLLYEASLLRHLERRGFDLAPRIHPARDGAANVWRDGQGWTLFHWLGDGPKTFRQEGTPERRAEAARVLARLHAAGVDFQPEGRRGDWPVFAGPAGWSQRWLPRVEALARELGEEGESLLTCARRSARELEAIDFSSLPVTVVHADYRMANILFHGHRVTAVFDFDVAFQAPRLLDMGRLLVGFRRGEGSLRLDIGNAVSTLQAAPLSDAEWEVLPAILRWRWVRDPITEFNQMWLDVWDTTLALFDGAAEEIVRVARRSTTANEEATSR